MYSFTFDSTIGDLLDAEEADRSLFLRKPFRWLVLTMGYVWLVVGLYTIVTEPGALPILWLAFGGVVIYQFAIAPNRRRSAIRASNKQIQSLTLEFADDAFRQYVSGVGEFTRNWNEVNDYRTTPTGILFYFSDGVTSWLPNRVFACSTEKKAFEDFLKNRIARD